MHDGSSSAVYHHTWPTNILLQIDVMIIAMINFIYLMLQIWLGAIARLAPCRTTTEINCNIDIAGCLLFLVQHSGIHSHCLFVIHH